MNSFKFYNYARKYFSVLPKALKMELTMRTPYRTFFKNFNGFTRVYITNQKGLRAISNRTYPQLYLLPPGEVKLIGMTRAEGNLSEPTSNGEFVHSGGWCMVHE
jgi:hypothetical protein